MYAALPTLAVGEIIPLELLAVVLPHSPRCICPILRYLSSCMAGSIGTCAMKMLIAIVVTLGAVDHSSGTELTKKPLSSPGGE